MVCNNIRQEIYQWTVETVHKDMSCSGSSNAQGFVASLIMLLVATYVQLTIVGGNLSPYSGSYGICWEDYKFLKVKTSLFR